MVPPYLTSCLRQDLPPPAAEAAAAGGRMGPLQLQLHCTGGQPALQGHLALRGCRQAQAQAQANDAVRQRGLLEDQCTNTCFEPANQVLYCSLILEPGTYFS